MGNTLGEDLARIRERGAEQLNYQSFLYQLSSVQCGIVSLSCLSILQILCRPAKI